MGNPNSKQERAVCKQPSHKTVVPSGSPFLTAEPAEEYFRWLTGVFRWAETLGKPSGLSGADRCLPTQESGRERVCVCVGGDTYGEL